MLPAAARLRTGREFTATVRGGRRAGTPLLVVHLLADRVGDAAVPRVGVAVGRGVGSAVVRNRVKRRLRHVLRDRLDRFPPGSRGVVRANPAAASASSEGLANALDSALDRLGAPARTTS